jgi:hypothetical protein
MKNIILLFICINSYNFNAQNWFDDSCKNIDENVTEEEFKTANQRNILKVIINQAGEVEINDVVKEGLSEIGFKEYVLDYVSNPDGDKNKADKPEKVIIQIKSLNKDSEQLKSIKYFIQDVYLYLWDKEATNRFKSTYVELNCKKREKVFNAYPLKMVSDISKKKSKSNSIPKRKGPGLPPFGGDVKQN